MNNQLLQITSLVLVTKISNLFLALNQNECYTQQNKKALKTLLL